MQGFCLWSGGKVPHASQPRNQKHIKQKQYCKTFNKDFKNGPDLKKKKGFKKSPQNCVCALVTQLCLTLWDPMDCSPPGSSVHGILQARKTKWVAISFSKGTSRPRDQTWVSCIAGWFFTVWAVLDNLRPPLNRRPQGNYSHEPIVTLPALSTLPSPFLLR